MDGLDPMSVGEAVAAASPDTVVNQMTGLSRVHTGRPNPRKVERFFAATNRLRSEGPHTHAEPRGRGHRARSHVVSQSHASFNGARTGGWVKTEEDPLEVTEGTKAVSVLEHSVVEAGGERPFGTAPSTAPAPTDDQVALVRRRLLPLVVAGTGHLVLGSTSTMPPAPRSWQWRSVPPESSTSSTTSRRWSASWLTPHGRVRRSAPALGASPCGRHGCSPERWW